MNASHSKAIVNEINLKWLQSPPFVNSMGITISLSNYEKCPNRCSNKNIICNVYDPYRKIIDKLPNPVNPYDITRIIQNFFPKISVNGSLVPNLDSKHVNIIVFKGDFMIPQNFEFISDLFEKLQDLEIGMKIATETIGSSDKKSLPILLAHNIIDSVTINLGVYPQWDNNVSDYARNALNSLTQCINAKTENEELHHIGISFLFDEHSSIDVFIDYLRIIDQSYRENEEELEKTGRESVFTYFNVYLRGDGTERQGIIEEAYHKGIEIFVEHQVKKLPIMILDKNKCIFCQT